MSEKPAHRNRPVSSHFHPLIYRGFAGLALCFVLALWGFARSGEAGYLLAVASGIVALAIGVLTAVWLVRHGDRRGGAAGEGEDLLGGWASGEFETWTGRVRGVIAAVEALLPIAAVAFGMIALLVALHIAVHAQ